MVDCNKIAFLKEMKSRFSQDIKKIYRVDGGRSYIIKFNSSKSCNKFSCFVINEGVLNKYNISDWTDHDTTFEIL